MKERRPRPAPTTPARHVVTVRWVAAALLAWSLGRPAPADQILNGIERLHFQRLHDPDAREGDCAAELRRMIPARLSGADRAFAGVGFFGDEEEGSCARFTVRDLVVPCLAADVLLRQVVDERYPERSTGLYWAIYVEGERRDVWLFDDSHGWCLRPEARDIREQDDGRVVVDTSCASSGQGGSYASVGRELCFDVGSMALRYHHTLYADSRCAPAGPGDDDAEEGPWYEVRVAWQQEDTLACLLAASWAHRDSIRAQGGSGRRDTSTCDVLGERLVERDGGEWIERRSFSLPRILVDPAPGFEDVDHPTDADIRRFMRGDRAPATYRPADDPRWEPLGAAP